MGGRQQMLRFGAPRCFKIVFHFCIQHPLKSQQIKVLQTRKKKAQSFEPRHPLEISSIDSGMRIQMKTISEFIVKILQINFVQIFPDQWDP